MSTTCTQGEGAEQQSNTPGATSLLVLSYTSIQSFSILCWKTSKIRKLRQIFHFFSPSPFKVILLLHPGEKFCGKLSQIMQKKYIHWIEAT